VRSWRAKVQLRFSGFGNDADVIGPQICIKQLLIESLEEVNQLPEDKSFDSLIFQSMNRAISSSLRYNHVTRTAASSIFLT
jgi:hypothetical protein